VWDVGGREVLGFLVVSDGERKQASERMFDLVCNWNRDTGFYESLKIQSLSDLGGKVVTWSWLLNEKLERPLVELLLEEKLVYPLGPGEITGCDEVWKSYMSILGEEIKRERDVRLITDDEFCIGAKSGVELIRAGSEKEVEEGYQLVSLAIPEVFIDEETLRMLSWEKVMEIRKDLLPFADSYHAEVESYEREINSLATVGKDEAAFEKLSEFCERVAISFRPFTKETRKTLRLARSPRMIGFINGVVLPAIKLIAPHAELAELCDIASVSSTSGHYILSRKRPLVGFDYLENLNRKLNVERLRGVVTCLIPKGLRGNTEGVSR